MDRKELLDKINSIKPADRQAILKAEARQASLAKPPGSLGGLEDMSVKIAGMTGRVINRIGRGCVAVFCADNGVAREGVSSAPQSVTRAQTINFTRRLTGVGALAGSYGSELLIVDMGVKDEIPKELYTDVPLEDTHKIVDRRLRPSGQTDNIAEGPAMTEEEALKAIETGIEMADAIAEGDFSIMGAGEMGIGNTTTSAALLSAITGRPAEDTSGRGGGVNDEGLARKKEIIDAVSADFREDGGILSAPEEDRAGLMIDALVRMGGFDICAMTGAYLGAAANRMPIVIRIHFCCGGSDGLCPGAGFGGLHDRVTQVLRKGLPAGHRYTGAQTVPVPRYEAGRRKRMPCHVQYRQGSLRCDGEHGHV